MRRLYVLAMTGVLALVFAVAVSAAPAGTSTRAEIPQGLKNAKKAMLGKLERDKKFFEVRKKGLTKKKQAKEQRQRERAQKVK